MTKKKLANHLLAVLIAVSGLLRRRRDRGNWVIDNINSYNFRVANSDP